MWLSNNYCVLYIGEVSGSQISCILQLYCTAFDHQPTNPLFAYFGVSCLAKYDFPFCQPVPHSTGPPFNWSLIQLIPHSNGPPIQDNWTKCNDAPWTQFLLILFLIQTLSSRNLPQSTLVKQPLPRYLMSPIHVSQAQSTGPPSQLTDPPNEPLNAKLCYSSVSDVVICF